MASKWAILAVAVSTLYIAGCSYVQPDAGHERVLIAKPYIFGHGGVLPEPVKSGSEIVAASTDAVDVNMMNQRVDNNFRDLMTADGVPVEVDTTAIIKVTDSVELIAKFGPNWYGDNIQAELANQVRQEVRQHGLQDIAIQTTSITDVQAKTKAAVVDYITKKNMPVQVVDIIIGKVLPPDAVRNQRIETAQQEQRVQTETQRQKAEDTRKGAETSRASADNAYRNSLGLSPEQFVQLEAINAQKEICVHVHCTFVAAGTSAIVAPK